MNAVYHKENCSTRIIADALQVLDYLANFPNGHELTLIADADSLTIKYEPQVSELHTDADDILKSGETRTEMKVSAEQLYQYELDQRIAAAGMPLVESPWGLILTCERDCEPAGRLQPQTCSSLQTRGQSQQRVGCRRSPRHSKEADPHFRHQASASRSCRKSSVRCSSWSGKSGAALPSSSSAPVRRSSLARSRGPTCHCHILRWSASWRPSWRWTVPSTTPKISLATMCPQTACRWTRQHSSISRDRPRGSQNLP